MTAPLPPAAPPWRFTLILLTGFAGLVSLIIVVRARTAQSAESTRRQALVRDLGLLVAAQDAAVLEYGRFARVIGPRTALDTIAFRPTNDSVTIRSDASSATGWSAVLRDEQLRSAPRSCGVFLGDVRMSPHRAVTVAARPACW